jgi:hypothetical protein
MPEYEITYRHEMECATHEVKARDIQEAMRKARAFMATDDYDDLYWEDFDMRGDLNTISVYGPGGSILEYEAPDFVASIRGKDYLHALRQLATAVQATLDRAEGAEARLKSQHAQTMKLLATAPVFTG